MSDAALAPTAEALARRVLASLPADRAHGRADIAGLPAPLAALLTARLDAAVERAAPVSRWLDPDDDRLRAATDAWRDAAHDAAQIPASEWEDAVETATRQALAHLIRPAETLADAAFEGERGPVTVETILGRIGAFGPYPYLPQIAARYAERKGVDRLDRAGLVTLLRRIDRRMVGAFGVDDWMTLVGPLFELVGPTGSPEGTVATSLLRPLFRSKDASALVNALDGIDSLDEGELRARLRDLFPSHDSPEPDAPIATEPDEALSAVETDESTDASRADEQPMDEAPDAEEPDHSAHESEPVTEPESSSNDALSGYSLEDIDDSPADESQDVDTPDADLSEEETLEEETSEDDADGAHPILGTRYGAPEFDGLDDSDILGPARPTLGSTATTPMETVRDAVTEAPAVSALDPESEARPVPPVPSIEPEPAETASSPVASDEPADSEAGDTEADDEPLWKRIARSQGDPEIAEVPQSPEPAPDDEPLWKRFADSSIADRLPERAGVAPPPPPPPSLDREFVPESFGSTASASTSGSDSPELDAVERAVLGDTAQDRRDWYVAELFGGSPSAYHRTLSRIEEAPSYTEATSVFSAEVLRRHRVSPYTDAAVSFIDAVQDRFELRD